MKNIDKAEGVLTLIEAAPEKHRQSMWRCNTGMCFAGWYTALDDMEWVADLSKARNTECQCGGEVKNCRACANVPFNVIAVASMIYDPNGIPAKKWLWGERGISVAGALKQAKQYNLAVGELTEDTLVNDAEHYAKREMDLDVPSANILFEGGNGKKDLVHIVELLKNGPVRAEWRDGSRQIVNADQYAPANIWV